MRQKFLGLTLSAMMMASTSLTARAQEQLSPTSEPDRDFTVSIVNAFERGSFDFDKNFIYVDAQGKETVHKLSGVNRMEGYGTCLSFTSEYKSETPSVSGQNAICVQGWDSKRVVMQMSANGVITLSEIGFVAQQLNIYIPLLQQAGDTGYLVTTRTWGRPTGDNELACNKLGTLVYWRNNAPLSPASLTPTSPLRPEFGRNTICVKKDPVIHTISGRFG